MLGSLLKKQPAFGYHQAMYKAVLTLLVGLVLSFSDASPVRSQETIDVGVMFGYSGPIETLTGDMANAAELALAEASSSGWFLGGKKISPVRITTDILYGFG